MNLLEVAAKRRSIRRFQERDVDDGLLLELFEAARLSPSAKNRQPWRFMVLRGEAKDHIAQLMEAWFEEDREIPRYAKSAKYTAKSIRQASVLILVYRQYDDVWEIGDTLSIGAALEHMCLRAEELGLGTLWIRDTCYTEDRICEYVGSGDLILTCSLAVGYPDEAPEARPRMNIEEYLLPVSGEAAQAIMSKDI